MIACVYARKSQPDEENVAGQVMAARVFAAARGWTIPDQYCFSDDGISGSVFGEGRPGLAKMLSEVTSPSRGFSILIIRDIDRIGRELWEIGTTLQAIIDAGVKVWRYQAGEELKLDSPIAKIMLGFHGFAAEDYKVKIVKNSRDAGRERAESGHVPGSRVFGYATKCDRCGGGHRAGRADGCEKARVRWVVNPAEAKAVVRIFEMYANGLGIFGIAKQLNVEHVPATGGRGWSQSGISAMLRNPHYIGTVVYGKKSTVAHVGKGKKVMRRTNPSTWITKEWPDLRIISAALWAKVTKERDRRRGPRDAGGRLHGRTPQQDTVGTRYPLSGIAICAECGGSIRATMRGVGPKKARRYIPNYGCATFETRGTCRNNVVLPAREIEAAVVARIIRYLDVDIIGPAVDLALARLVEQRGPAADRRRLLEVESAKLEQKGRRLAAAIADGGELGALVDALKVVEKDKAERLAEIEALMTDAAPVDPEAVKAALVSYTKDLQALLAGTPEQTRTVLRQLLRGKIKMEPFRVNGTRGYRFAGELALNRILAGEATSPLSATTGPRSRTRR